MAKIFETEHQASEEYKKYIQTHIENVQKAYKLFGLNVCEYIASHSELVTNGGMLYMTLGSLVKIHDDSKLSKEEFEAYRNKYYPSKTTTKSPEDIEKDFDIAWTHHYENNPHHPEHWVKHSEIHGKEIILSMDEKYIAEMLMDWISMSMASKQSLFNWWNNNPNGKKEKKSLMDPQVFHLVDKWIYLHKEDTDFSKV